MGCIVTISGDLGSGKTSVAKLLSERCTLNHISVGKMYRRMAEELGMNSLELNLHAERNPDFDRYFDNVLLGLIKDGRDYIIESRTAWWQVKNTLKVYLTVDPDVGTERVIGDRDRRNEPRYTDHGQAKAQLRARKESERRRYAAEYGIDVDDPRNYDVVIDSTVFTIQQIVDELARIITQWRFEKANTFEQTKK